MIGEQVKTQDEFVRLQSKAKRAGVHTVYNLEVYRDHNFLVSTNGILVHNECFTGIAKKAVWVKPKQGNTGLGLRNHFAKHGLELGLLTVKEYDISARRVIQFGKSFRYRDPTTNDPRVGYFKSGLFTATSSSRKVPAILSHYELSLDKIKKLPGFTWE